MEQQANQPNVEVINLLLQKANQKLGAKLGLLENDLALAHAQVEFQQEQLQKYQDLIKKQQDQLLAYQAQHFPTEEGGETS